jgi:nitrogen-specific signal transduction histidine kinase
MKNPHKTTPPVPRKTPPEWKDSWRYVQAALDTAREPFLVLDAQLRIMSANETFCRTFQVEMQEIEGTPLFSLGNGQWDIPLLRKLLEKIIPRNTFFKGFEMAYDFPHIGRKVFIINARQMNPRGAEPSLFPQVILVAMEDVTEMMSITEQLAVHTAEFESMVVSKMQEFDIQIQELRQAAHACQEQANRRAL